MWAKHIGKGPGGHHESAFESDPYIYIDIQISVIINEFVVHAVFWFAPLFFWGPVVFDFLVGVSAFNSSISDAAGQGLLSAT